MLKINNQQTIPFDPETDVGYALDKDGDLWYFGDDVIEFSEQEPASWPFETDKAKLVYGPFTRFQGTATIGND